MVTLLKTMKLLFRFIFLKAIGHEVHTTSPGKLDGQYITTCIHDLNAAYQAVTEWEGHKFKIDIGMSEVDPANYDVLVLPGGRAPETLRNSSDVMRITTDFIDQKKLIASICRGLQILLATGRMKGKAVTGHLVCEAEARVAGALWQRKDFNSVQVTDNFIMGTEFPGMHTWLAALHKAIS